MADRATPNLPSSDFDRTEAFYASLGFVRTFRDEGWMILERGGLQIEFFPDPDVDPLRTAASCCLRLDDLDGFYAMARGTGLPEARTGEPRLHPPRHMGDLRIGGLVDPDGSLLHLLGN
jgi:hypothetical protein